MQSSNPYQPPQTPVDRGLQSSPAMEQTASGQKLVIRAFLVYFLAVALRLVLGPLGAIVGLAAFVMAIIGVVRVGSGLGMSVLVRVLLVILMFVPLINLITLLVINSRATAALRSAGYKVGFLGVSN